MGYVVDVIDTTDYRLAADTLYTLAHNEPDTTVIRIPATVGGLGFMVSQVLARTKNKEMNVLRIWGHGATGVQNVGAGLSDDGWKYDGSIDIRHFEQCATLMSSLRPRFYSTKSRIELRGCQVAGGSDGQEFMIKLSQAVGVRVLAAKLDQYGLGWIGSVYQAEPSGTFKEIYYTTEAIHRPASQN